MCITDCKLNDRLYNELREAIVLQQMLDYCIGEFVGEYGDEDLIDWRKIYVNRLDDDLVAIVINGICKDDKYKSLEKFSDWYDLLGMNDKD